MANKKHKLRCFFVNLLCGVVAGEHKRRKIRVILNTKFLSIYRFVKQDCGLKRPRINVVIGTRGQNLVICVSNKYVYKFRVAIDDFDDSLEKREYAITSELAKVAPLKILVPKILRYNHGIARRYNFVPGVNFKTIVKNGQYDLLRDFMAKQLAEFIYKISSVDPEKIRKYKKKSTQQPGYMLGWYHIDLFENFLIDDKTGRITGVIDWEDADFVKFDLNRRFYKFPLFEKFMGDVKSEYDCLYKNGL